MSDRKLRVFLCHASQDKPIVRELYLRLLKEEWIDPWLDEEKLLPGQDWDMEIKKAVRAADAVIVCLSNESVFKEGYIQKEIRFVLDVADEKPEGMIFVVPLRINECSVPHRLQIWHYIDYFPESRQERLYRRLIASLILKANTLDIHIDAAKESNLRDSRFSELLDSNIVASSTTLDPENQLKEIVFVTKSVLRARFVYISLVDQAGKISHHASAGEAPKILSYLLSHEEGNTLLQASINSMQVIRVRSINTLDPKITLDDADLQSFIAMPLRLHKLTIGSILVFGKNDAIAFSEEDEILATLLGVQICAAIEGRWLYTELRDRSKDTSSLYQWSAEIINMQDVTDALKAIVNTARAMSNATSGGIILYNRDDNIDASVGFDSSGIRFDLQPPSDLVKQAIENKQSIIASTEGYSKVCYPLYTPYRSYGAMWLNLSESRGIHFANLQTLAAQASLSIERLILLREARW